MHRAPADSKLLIELKSYFFIIIIFTSGLIRWEKHKNKKQTKHTNQPTTCSISPTHMLSLAKLKYTTK